MKTIVLNEPGQLTLVQRPMPEAPGAGEALVQVHRIGICGTDIHAYHGKQPFFTYPRVLGHELGVEVLATGAGVSNVKPGDRCSFEPYLNCGTCIACRRGKGNCCTVMRVLGVHSDGGMCERIVLPARKLHVSQTLSYDQLALIEMLGIGAHAVARGKPEKGENVLVLGAGPIGLSVIQFAQASGARVIVADVSESRVAFAREKMKVSDVVLANAGNPATALEKVKTLTDGDFPTVVFDATGNPQSMMGAFEYVAHGGKLVFVGLFQGDVTFHDPGFHRRELTLMGSRNALPADFGRIIRLMENGQVDTSPWITHRAKLAELPGVFDDWLKPDSGVLKAMVEVDES